MVMKIDKELNTSYYLILSNIHNICLKTSILGDVYCIVFQYAAVDCILLVFGTLCCDLVSLYSLLYKV